VACPSRRVVTLTGDGSAFYTLQALWTMARSKLDATVVILANGSYRILNNEMEKIGAGTPDAATLPLITLNDPAPDWVALARGHGVAAGRAETTQEFARLFRESLGAKGPRLIEAVL
jgi:acetolactate synthase-1/2/3 large subunit